MWRVKVSSFSWGVMNEMKKLMTDTFRSRWYCSPCPTLWAAAKDPSSAAPHRQVHRRRYGGRLLSVYVTRFSFQITKKKIPSNPTMFNEIWQLIRRFQSVRGTGKWSEAETMMRRCLRKVWRTKKFFCRMLGHFLRLSLHLHKWYRWSSGYSGFVSRYKSLPNTSITWLLLFPRRKPSSSATLPKYSRTKADERKWA